MVQGPMLQHVEGPRSKMVCVEWALNGKLSVFVTGPTPNAVGALNKKTPASAASPMTIRLMHTPPESPDSPKSGRGYNLTPLPTRDTITLVAGSPRSFE